MAVHTPTVHAPPLRSAARQSPRRTVGRIVDPVSWGRCRVRLREHWHWLRVCADCGQQQPPGAAS